MIETNTIFLHGFFSLLVTSIFSTLFVLYQFKKTEPIDARTLFLFGYLSLGTLSFVADWYGMTFSTYKPLALSSMVIMVCTIFLLFSLLKSKRYTAVVKIICLLHIALIVWGFMVDDEQLIMSGLILHGLVVYSWIGWLAIKRYQEESNFGYGIISFAAFLIPAMIVIQLAEYSIGNFNIAVMTVVYATAFMLVGVGFLGQNLVEQNKKLGLLAIKDPLTGLLNRRGLEQSVVLIVKSLKKDNNSLSAITLDIDHFKNINDTFGHDTGDRVLIEFAQLIKKECKLDNQCCRMGGEEFVILLPFKTLNQAKHIAEKLRTRIENQSFVFQEQTFQVTSSLGVAHQNGDIDIDFLLQQADKALYEAKRNGRNRVEVSAT